MARNRGGYMAEIYFQHLCKMRIVVIIRVEKISIVESK
jgi:hypothetical protein